MGYGELGSQEVLMRSLIVSALSIILFLSAGCEAAPPKGSASKGKDWVKHSSPSGFIVQHPLGWSVEEKAEGTILVQSANKTTRVVIQPFFLRQPVSAEQWLQKMPTLLAGGEQWAVGGGA